MLINLVSAENTIPHHESNQDDCRPPQRAAKMPAGRGDEATPHGSLDPLSQRCRRGMGRGNILQSLFDSSPQRGRGFMNGPGSTHGLEKTLFLFKEITARRTTPQMHFERNSLPCL